MEARQEQALRTAREYGPGVLASVALHGLLLFLLLWLALRHPIVNVPAPLPPIVPIDVIRLGENTTSPPTPLKSHMPQQARLALRGPRTEASAPEGVAPRKMRPTPNDLEAKLKALSLIRAPEAPASNGVSNTDTSSDNAAPGDDAAYAVRDYVRAQVIRRWGLDLDILGKRQFTIPLHVKLTTAGVVTTAEIVDRQRFNNDAVYRRVALSARNAVLLSSPIILPPGTPASILDMTLQLNPRDALR